MLISQNSLPLSLRSSSHLTIWAEANCKCTLVHCKLDAEIHRIVHFSTFNWHYKFSKLQPIGYDVSKERHITAHHTYWKARYLLFCNVVNFSLTPCGSYFHFQKIIQSYVKTPILHCYFGTLRPTDVDANTKYVYILRWGASKIGTLNVVACAVRPYTHACKTFNIA